MIQFASYLVCLGKRERKKDREKKEKEVGEKKEKEKEKSVRKKKIEEKNSDLSRLNLVVEFGLESVLCTV